MTAGALAGAVVLLLLGAMPTQARPSRILSLDQCADQYALALAPDATLALSPRADDPDSWLRNKAQGRLMLRPTLETAVGFQPDAVIRSWGGEPRLLAALERRGVRVIQIEDASDMNGVRANITQAANALGRPARGEALVAHMDRSLAYAGRSGHRGSALYLTAGGFTAGSGTLIGAILTAAGFRNLAPHAGFGPVSVERIALEPPTRFVLGFFEQLRADWRGAGRHPVIRRAAEQSPTARLPGSALSCPAWFAADAAVLLADQSL